MHSERQSWLEATPSKTAFAFGLVLGLGMAALAGFAILLNLFYAGNLPTKVAGTQTGQNQPSAQVPNDFAPPAPVEITLNDADKPYAKGPEKAKVVVVEYSDFECPFCGRFAPTVTQMLSEYKDKVRFVYRHFPLDQIHPQARPAAIASVCAAEQGKFFEYHDQLFAKQSQLTPALYPQLAKDLGLNEKKFNDCLTSPSAAAKVEADYQSGIASGVQGTPATFVNGNLISGAQPYEVLKNLIEEELKG